MVEEQKLGCGACQVQSAHRDVIDARMAESCQVELQVMGENRPDDIPMGHEHQRSVLRGVEHLFHCRHRSLLYLP